MNIKDKIKQQRIKFGKDILGAIFWDFCHRLHLHFLAYDDRDTVFLFCTRAGLRLQHLYELFISYQGYQKAVNQNRIFWLSRFMTAKGLFKRNPTEAYKIIAGEFQYTNTRTMLPCLLPTEKEAGMDTSYQFFQQFAEETLSAEFSQDILSATPNEQILSQIFSSKGTYGNLLQKHYSQQAQLFEKQIQELVGNKKNAVLVDSGWQATTQRLLMESYPEIDWHGLYFGRMGSIEKNNWHFFNVIGLMFESYNYEIDKPETSIYHYRHLIEDLLEPSIPSVEYLRLDPTSNKILPPSIYDNFDYWTPEENQHHYQGIIEYFNEVGSPLSLLEIRRRSKEAWDILDRQIRFPTKEEAIILEGRSRSADFGKGNEASPILIHRSRFVKERSAETRIKNSLWIQGQIALEYPQKHLKKQQEYAQENEPVLKPILENNSSIPTVAVITRTKDRPIMLKRAAKSVANQTLQDFLWVVVNDGGDKTEVDKIIANSPVDLRRVITIHHPESLGMESASNRGIANSQSKYIAIHDDDDTWQPQFLERTVEFLENPPTPSFLGVIAHAKRISEVIIDDEYIEILHSSPYQEWVKTVPLYEMASMNMFAPISFLFPRSVYDEIGGFDEQLPVLGDWDFNIRFLMKYDIGVIPELLANYHHRDNLHSGNYSNSLLGAISKHQMYDAVVRNRSLRKIVEDGNLPLTSILSFGRATYDLRKMLQTIIEKIEQ